MGHPGHFTADQLGAAIKLVYDNVAWGVPYPVADAGTNAAVHELRVVMSQVAGITGRPILKVSLKGGRASFKGTATLSISVTVPGSNRGLAGVSVAIRIRGATVTGSSAT